MYAKIEETATRNLISSVREYMKRWSWDGITVEKDGLSSAERRDAVMGVSGSVTDVWTLPSVKTTFVSVKERGFRTYVKDALVSVSDCYAGQLMDHDHVNLLRERTERYETYEQLE